DGAGVVQSNYAVTRTDGFMFAGAAGPWAIGAVTLMPAGTADAGAPDAGVSADAAADVGVQVPDSTVAPTNPGDAGAVESRNVDLRVGCACRTGGQSGGSTFPLFLGLIALLRPRVRG